MTKLFGTDGIRGKAGEFPIEPKSVFKLGFIFAKLTGYNTVAIGWDTRESSKWIAEQLISGLKKGGSSVKTAGCLPTPVLSFCIKNMFDGGIMITASHNPYTDNGLKFFNKDGEKISDSLENEIEKLFLETEVKSEKTEKIENFFFLDKKLTDFYLSEISSKINTKGIQTAYPVDCANGATSLFIKEAEKILNIKFNPYNCKPNGKNINLNCGAAQPKFIQNNSFAFDGDGDRIMAKDSDGRIINGDIILMFLAEKLKLKKLVGTVMTNAAVEIFCKEKGIAFERTKVGDRFVKEKMKQTNAELGGETSGHIILNSLNQTGDGFAVYLKLLELLNKENMTLQDLTENYPLFPQKLINIPVKKKIPLNDIPGFSELIEKIESLLPGKGRIFPRYSGTENLLRILLETNDKKSIEICERKIKQFFNKTEV